MRSPGEISAQIKSIAGTCKFLPAVAVEIQLAIDIDQLVGKSNERHAAERDSFSRTVDDVESRCSRTTFAVTW
jgi:hypothetical protein